MGVRREERITMSEGSFLRIWESPLRRGPVDIVTGGLRGYWDGGVDVPSN